MSTLGAPFNAKEALTPSSYNASGEIVGAIGISGSAVENDQVVAEAGSKAI